MREKNRIFLVGYSFHDQGFSLGSLTITLLFGDMHLISLLFIFLMQIDSNTDGLVDFTEFVAATLHVHQLEEHDSEKWQQLSRAAFEKFDIDRDGYITPDELRMVSVNSLHPLTTFLSRRLNTDLDF